MFTFMHTYTQTSWEGLLKNGLFREGDGLKIMHSSYMPQPYDFNSIAKKGGILAELLKELRCPFYVDRFQGGIPFSNWYEYDKELIQYYKALLGENFWGFQIHEWASNVRSDCDAILNLYESSGHKYPNKKERQKIWKEVCNGEKDVFVEAFTFEEWAGRRDPENRNEFLEAINELYAIRTRQTDGMLVPADSFFMAPRIECVNGAKLLLPEVGWQIPDMRIQMAYTRGQAKSYKVRWGIYYECWGNTTECGLTFPFSLREGQDEWQEDQLHTGAGAEKSPEERERGGSSRSLQERAWRYAYLSGASVMGEEYGVCNTFRNYYDFDLSPYGQVKQQFLRFIERFPDVGETYAPIAVVLPATLPIWEIRGEENGYLRYPFDEDTNYIKHLREVMEALFGKMGEYGNQGHVIKNGGYPDLFDIVHADQTEALNQYLYLIDLSNDPSFADRHNNIIKIHELESVMKLLLPCYVSGGFHTIYNRTKEGWILLIMNHDGILCDHFAGDVRLPEATLQGQILTNGRNITVLDGNYRNEPHLSGQNYDLCLEGGEWMMVAVNN